MSNKTDTEAEAHSCLPTKKTKVFCSIGESLLPPPPPPLCPPLIAVKGGKEEMEDFPLLLLGPSFDCGDWPFLPTDDWTAEKKKKEANEMGDQPTDRQTARSRPKKYKKILRLCSFCFGGGAEFWASIVHTSLSQCGR